MLPRDIDYFIGFNLDYNQIVIFGQVNKRYSQLLDSPIFWESKAIKDFGTLPDVMAEIYPLVSREKYIPEREAYLKLAGENGIPLPYTEKYGKIFELAMSAATLIVKTKSRDITLLNRFMQLEFAHHVFQIFGEYNRKDLLDKFIDEYSTFKIIISGEALLGAVAGAHFDLIKSLVTSGLCNNQEALNLAIRNKNSKLIKYLIQQPGISLNNALYHAAYTGDNKLVNFIISRGANHYNCGLHGAIKGNSRKIMDLMISLGADDFDGGLFEAASSGNLDLIKYMMERGGSSYNASLVEAAAKGNLMVIKFLVDHGADKLNAALESAVTGKNQEEQLLIVKYLVSQGANNLNRGLIYAGGSQNRKIVDFLICQGANDFFTTLKIAVETDNLYLFTYLVKYITPEQIIILFRRAVVGQQYSIVEFILKKYRQVITPSGLDFLRIQAQSNSDSRLKRLVKYY